MRFKFSFLLINICCLALFSFAQKAKKEKQALVIVTGKVLSPDDSAQVVQLFYSGLREKVVQNPSLALDYFKQILLISPDSQNALYELGQIYFKKGDLISAKNFAQQAVTVEPNNEWYWLLNANIYQQQQDFELLAYALDELIKLNPDNLDYVFDKANAYFMMGKADEALVIYNDLEKQIGLSDQVLQGRQRIFLKKGNIAKATEDLNQLIKNNPTEVRYYLFLGDLYFANKMGKEALGVYQKAKDLDPENPFTRMAIAQILEAQGNDDEAYKEIKIAFEQPSLNIDQKVKIILKYFDAFPNPSAMEKAQSLSKILTEAHPQDPKTFSLYGDVMFQSNQLNEAEKAYTTALTFNKNIYAIWDQLLRIQLSTNNFKAVISTGEEAVTYFPNQFSLYFYTALAYLQDKNYQQAITYFNMALSFEIDNKDIQAQINGGLGDAHQAQKKYKESASFYEKALEISPNDTYVLNNYAYYLSLRNEELLKAERMSGLANKLEPDNAAFEDTYAWIFFKIKKYYDAKIWIFKAIQHNPNSPTQYEHLGDIYFKLGDVDSALENWKKAFELDGSDTLLKKKIDEKKYFD
jgi:tetratricopeptide (TPR) repeat protein